jgi:hypothetical protein
LGRAGYATVGLESDPTDFSTAIRNSEKAKAQFQKSWDAWRAWAKLEEVD